LKDGEFAYEMNNRGLIKVRIGIDKAKRSATIDFTGTSDQLPNVHHRRALRRIGRDGCFPGHDEQLHFRQRRLSVLRNNMRGFGRG
jgi:hypothetical protein